MLPKILQILALLSIVASASVAAQNVRTSKSPLSPAFKGKKVLLKIDMPGDYTGINLWPDNADLKDSVPVSDRINKFGASLHINDISKITKVVVNEKKIELHLGGGGYNSRLFPKPPLPIKISYKEAFYKRKHDEDPDGPEASYYWEEYNKLKTKREDDDRINRQNYENNLPELIRQARLRNGSRFILHFTTISAKSVTPEKLMEYLADYIDFSPVKLIRNTSDVRPTQRPPCLTAGLFSGEWQNSDKDTICIRKQTLTFDSGPVIRFQENFRLVAERIFVITTTRNLTGAGPVVLIKVGEKEMKLSFYRNLNDLKDGTNNNGEETWTKKVILPVGP